MFGIKKKGRATTQKLHSFLKDLLSPVAFRIANKLRMQGRMRLANRWARKHPKYFISGYCILAVTILSGTLLWDFMIRDRSEDKESIMSSIVPINHRLKYLEIYEANQQMLKNEIAELGRRGMVLYNEMDSLMRIENKTREDSTRIACIYTNLNSIFNNKQHESEKH